MKCPNCKKIYKENYTCPTCGVSVIKDYEIVEQDVVETIPSSEWIRISSLLKSIVAIGLVVYQISIFVFNPNPLFYIKKLIFFVLGCLVYAIYSFFKFQLKIPCLVITEEGFILKGMLKDLSFTWDVIYDFYNIKDEIGVLLEDVYTEDAFNREHTRKHYKADYLYPNQYALSTDEIIKKLSEARREYSSKMEDEPIPRREEIPQDNPEG
jgi:hypothetical protein